MNCLGVNKATIKHNQHNAYTGTTQYAQKINEIEIMNIKKYVLSHWCQYDDQI